MQTAQADRLSLSGAIIILAGAVVLHAAETAKDVSDVYRRMLSSLGLFMLLIGGVMVSTGNTSPR